MRKLWSLVALLLLTVLLTGCAQRASGDKTVVEWSRGHQIGLANQSGPVALDVSPDGRRIVSVWPASRGRDDETLHMVALDSEGAILADLDLPVIVNEPTEPQLVLGAEDQVHLAWIAEQDDTQGLFYAPFTLDGQLANPPQRLSLPDFRVSGYQIAALPTGEILAVLADRSGLTALRIGADGQVQRSQMPEVERAHHPSFQIDDAGLVHLSWHQSSAATERQIYYTTFDPSTMTFSWPMYLSTIVLKSASSFSGSGETLLGPFIALEDEHVIVGWTRSETSGSNDSSFYIHFAPQEVRELVPKRIALPPGYPPDYAPASGSFSYQQLAAPLSGTAVTRRTFLRTGASTVSGQVDQVPLAVGLWVRTAWSPQLQPALVILDDGKVKGYQVVGWTRYPSLHPSLAADDDGDLYLAWLDATGSTFPVYLATTDPSLLAVWDRLTVDDLTVTLAQLFGRLVSAMGVVLVAVSWIILPGFFLVVALFVIREDNLDSFRGNVALLLLVGLHWAGKFLFTPEVLTSLPRLSDLPLIFPQLTLLVPGELAYLPQQAHLPAFVAPLMPYVLPALTLIAGAIVARMFYLKRIKYPSFVIAYIIVAVVDIFLAIQIYALTHYDPVKF